MKTKARLLIGVISLSLATCPNIWAIKTITIGVAGNFSAMSDSASNPYGNYFRDAVDMAFDENRKTLASKGIVVRLKEFDYGDSPLKVIGTANAIVKSRTIAVIGYLYSADVLLAAPILSAGKLLLLTPTATDDRVEKIGRYVRRTCFSDSYQGRILANYAIKTQHIKTVGIVYAADCAYCVSLRVAFKQRFESLGGRVLVDQSILSTDNDYKDTIEAFSDKPVEAIFLPNYERVSATIIDQLLDAGIKPRIWLGGDGWGSSVDLFYHITGMRKFTAYVVTHWNVGLKTQKSERFVINFMRHYGKTPVDTAVLSYDAADLLIKALLNAKRLDRGGILASVEKIKTFTGVTGRLVYQNLARTPEKPAIILQIKNGRTTIVEQISAHNQ